MEGCSLCVPQSEGREVSDVSIYVNLRTED